MLPDRAILIGQKIVENAKIKKFKCDIFADFQTMCSHCMKINRKSHMNFRLAKQNKIGTRQFLARKFKLKYFLSNFSLVYSRNKHTLTVPYLLTLWKLLLSLV